MDENDHGIFFAGLYLNGWEKPALNVEAVVRPLKILGFAPLRRLRRVVAGQLAPITDRSGPNLRWRFKVAAFCGREFAIPGNSEGRKITEGVKILRAFPNRSHRIIGERQFRDRTCAADYLVEKDPIRRLPEKRTYRAFATSRAVQRIMAVGRDSEQVAAVE